MHSVKTHPFHLSIDFTRLTTIATLHILVLPPRIITEPAEYVSFVSKRRFATLASIPAPTDVTETGFAVLGVLGVDYANIVIGKAFRTIAMGISVDDTLKRGYAAVRSAINIYARHWRKKKDVKIELRQPLVSEKTPRRPAERERIVKTNITRVNPNPLHPINQEVRVQPNQRHDNIRDSGSPEKESQGEMVHSPHQPSSPEDVSSMPQNSPHTPQRIESSRNVSPMYGNASGPRTVDLDSRSQVSMSDLSFSPPWLTPRHLPRFPNTERSLGSSFSRSSPRVSPTVHIAPPQTTTVSGRPSSRIPRPNFNRDGSHLLGSSDILASKMGQVVKRSADEEPFQVYKRRKLNVGPTMNDASAGMKSYIPIISSRYISNAKLPKRVGSERSHYTRNRPTLLTKLGRIPRLQKQSVSIKSVTSGNYPSPSISLECGITPTSSLPETLALTRICETNDAGRDHPENVGARLSLGDDHDQSISPHPPASTISSVNSEIQTSTSSLSTTPAPEPSEFSPSTFTNQVPSDSGEDTFPSPSIPSSPSTVSIPLSRSLQVSPEFHELLHLSIYPIEHLASSASPIEELTLRVWVAMCLLAKQRGAIRAFKKLWGKYPVKLPIGWEVNDEDSCECTPTPTEINSQPERSTLDATTHQSPVRDLSPPPPFRRGRLRVGRNGDAALVGPRYRYYRATFAGRYLPVLLIGYCCPITKKLICCYGGTKNGERVHLGGWRCVSNLDLDSFI